MNDLSNAVGLLRKEHERLSKEMNKVAAALSAFGATPRNGAGRGRRMSAAGRARIAAAQRARWARVRAKAGKNNNNNVVTIAAKRKLSAAARRKIAAAQRARWAKVRAAKKSA